MTIKLRVLVVDDSALMRRLISDLLESDPGIEVVGTAQDGLEAIEKVASLRPDVVTLDVEMPRLNGLEALSQIMQQNPTPVVMLTGLSHPDVAVEALEQGAVDFVVKPSGTISVDLYKIRDDLIAKVRLARLVNMRKITRPQLPRPAARPIGIPPRRSRSPRRAVVIGASTGGPRAVEFVLAALPEDLPAPVLVVQHMPPAFTRTFAERLDQRSRLRVQEAEHGHRLAPGHALVAPGGYHMRVRRGNARSGGIIALDQSPPVGGLRPCADVTMADVAEVYGSGSVGVVLTGMGSDGARGVEQIKAAGGLAMAQDQETSVIYGMPRAAGETGVLDRVLPLPEIPGAIVRAATGRLEEES